MTLTTPALLFSAISLLLLAYTNRFLVIARLIRDLHDAVLTERGDLARRQIPSLRRRVRLIRNMQAVGVLSFLLCTTSMLCLFVEAQDAGRLAFGASVIALLASLAMSLVEIVISTQALEIVLDDVDRPPAA